MQTMESVRRHFCYCIYQSPSQHWKYWLLRCKPLAVPLKTRKLSAAWKEWAWSAREENVVLLTFTRNNLLSAPSGGQTGKVCSLALVCSRLAFSWSRNAGMQLWKAMVVRIQHAGTRDAFTHLDVRHQLISEPWAKAFHTSICFLNGWKVLVWIKETPLVLKGKFYCSISY